MGASSSSPQSQSAADDLQASLSSTVDAVVMQSVVPVQKTALRCTLACCDTATSPADLAACSTRCDASVQAAQAVLQGAVGEFQARLQRAAQACADRARGGLPASPSERDAKAARARMDTCVVEAAAAARGDLPMLKQRVTEAIPRAVAAAADGGGGRH